MYVYEIDTTYSDPEKKNKTDVLYVTTHIVDTCIKNMPWKKMDVKDE